MLPPNYVPDLNKFQLAGPPDTFRRQLWEFDPSLVVVPSRMGFYYRLAQRRKPQFADHVAYEALKEQADTAMLLSYGLVPVTTILATVNWHNPFIFVELANRAPWRMGGADAVNKMLEDQDRKDELDKQAKNDEMLTDVSKDAWRYYNKLIGTRSHLYSPTVKKPAAEAKTPAIVLPNSIRDYKPAVMTQWGGRKG